MVANSNTPVPFVILPNGYHFQIDFELPKSTQGDRPAKPFKTMKQEELIWPFPKFIGALGGSLGLMIGFSFLQIANWATDNCFMAGERCRQIIVAYH